MNMDDLERIFWNDVREQPVQVRLRRVVKALAPDDDEIAAYNRLSYKVREQLKCECDYLPEDKCIRCSVMEALKCLETRFNDILGGAGNEKAAGGPTREAGQATLGNSQGPAADPSPEVCEWTGVVGHAVIGCAGYLSTGNYKRCPSCGKPIKFKEETR